ncbi:MAG: hypothetical protein IKW30_06075 [Lachnospiraceae bacterium]|nr:hypothetical protein [Lachnospiraceae bacterium]
MKAVISGCGGLGDLRKDTDYIVHKGVAGGMIIVAVDTSEAFEDGMAQEIAQRIIYEWEGEPQLSEERLQECLQVGTQISSKISVTILVLDKKEMGIAHNGNNKIFHIMEGQIDDLTIPEEETGMVDIYEYTAKPEDAFVVMTDGFASYIQEQEVLIDYTKSRTPKDLISYLSTRVGLRQKECFDSYTAMALIFE